MVHAITNLRLIKVSSARQRQRTCKRERRAVHHVANACLIMQILPTSGAISKFAREIPRSRSNNSFSHRLRICFSRTNPRIQKVALCELVRNIFAQPAVTFVRRNLGARKETIFRRNDDVARNVEHTGITVQKITKLRRVVNPPWRPEPPRRQQLALTMLLDTRP